MTKHQILMLRRHLKVVGAAYEQMLARENTPSEKALITDALEDARATLLGLDDLKPTD